MAEILPRNEQSESVQSLLDALELAEIEFLPVIKDSDNPFYKSKYADLGTVLDAIKPALKKHKLRIQPFTFSEQDRAGTILRLIHLPSQEYIQTVALAGVEKLTPQGFGSVWTYTRRYSISNLLNLAAEDDDGTAGSGGDKQPIRKADKAKVSSTPRQSTPPSPLGVARSEANSGYVPSDTDIPDLIGSSPTESTTSPTLVFSADGKMFDPWKSRANTLVNSLRDAGLTKAPGEKLLAYILNDAGISDKLKLTVVQFETATKEIESLLAVPATKQIAVNRVDNNSKEKEAK